MILPDIDRRAEKRIRLPEVVSQLGRTEDRRELALAEAGEFHRRATNRGQLENRKKRQKGGQK